MRESGYRRNAETTQPACVECGATDRCADTCGQTGLRLDLLDDDLARLAARGGRPFTRRIAQAERDMLAGMGLPVPRADRHQWRVRVHQYGPDGVRRVLSRAGRCAAEIDEPVTAGATS